MNDALRATMIDGAGFGEVGGKIGICAAWGVVSFVLAIRFFKWR